MPWGINSTGGWSGAATSAASSGGGGFWGGLASGIGSLFGGSSNSGGGGGSSGGWGNIFSSMLGGLGGMADAKMGQAQTREQHDFNIASIQKQSEEQRRNIGFAADMEDFYNQKNKVRKRAALDTYGQFSLLDRYAPNMQAAPPIDPGVRPST